MKTYIVTIPFTGTLCVEVEADNLADAMEQAYKTAELTEDNVNEVFLTTEGMYGRAYE